MINGIIKLFYSEIVKTNMKKMPSSDYQLRDECREIRNIALKIDKILLNIIKLMIYIAVIIFSFNINILLGIGIILLQGSYIIYKIKLESTVKENVENIKNNIELPKINISSEKSKSGLNALATLLLIGLITGFNRIIVASFIVVFIFTIKDIYSNIK